MTACVEPLKPWSVSEQVPATGDATAVTVKVLPLCVTAAMFEHPEVVSVMPL